MVAQISPALCTSEFWPLKATGWVVGSAWPSEICLKVRAFLVRSVE
jgi:hypothetical protein